ncbi:transcription cofactor HES-6 [Eucyclogobius newberryi]|uniref:transcription cofactor HES-6 n=1 Tax=Eucyclogobius newberryi TaxID=166745 RepID=UPI003B5980C7
MAPANRDNSSGPGPGEHGPGEHGHGSGRKIRKPLVEKKRRARINESLKELRVLLADADLKMENAEVLELTVRRAERVLQDRAHEMEAVDREACERFAAGYIQCMHDVHTFVSNCPDIEPSVVTELLNHLLESMPLNNEDRLRLLEPDSLDELPSWSLNEVLCSGLISPTPSTTSFDDLCSDLDEAESEHSHVSSSEESDVLCLPSFSSKSMWRPW